MTLRTALREGAIDIDLVSNWMRNRRICDVNVFEFFKRQWCRLFNLVLWTTASFFNAAFVYSTGDYAQYKLWGISIVFVFLVLFLYLVIRHDLLVERAFFRDVRELYSRLELDLNKGEGGTNTDFGFRGYKESLGPAIAAHVAVIALEILVAEDQLADTAEEPETISVFNLRKMWRRRACRKRHELNEFVSLLNRFGLSGSYESYFDRARHILKSATT